VNQDRPFSTLEKVALTLALLANAALVIILWRFAKRL